MTQTACPSCGHRTPTRAQIQESRLDWACRSCKRTFEIRIVFFERPRPVDNDRFRRQVLNTMRRQGLTQAELGRMIGVSAAYISTILSGKRRVSPQLAERIRRALERGLGAHPKA